MTEDADKEKGKRLFNRLKAEALAAKGEPGPLAPGEMARLQAEAKREWEEHFCQYASVRADGTSGPLTSEEAFVVGYTFAMWRTLDTMNKAESEIVEEVREEVRSQIVGNLNNQGFGFQQ